MMKAALGGAGRGTCRPPFILFCDISKVVPISPSAWKADVCVTLHPFFYTDNLSGHKPKLSPGERGPGGSRVTGPAQHSILSEGHSII